MSYVLIIEDEVSTATPVKAALEMDGIQADIASDGNIGLDLFRKNAYDLILLDLKLPGLTGEEVLSIIRKEDPFITVIVYTNYSNFADIKRLANIGIDGYINKGPGANLDELINTIENKLAPIDDTSIDALFKDLPKN